MKKWSARLSAMAIVAALLLTFASCQKDTPANASAPPSGTLSTDDTRPSATEAESTLSTPSTTVKTKSTTASTTAADKNKPLSQAEILALYNRAIRSGLRRTSYSRTMDSGKLWSPGNFDDKEFDLAGDENVRKVFDTRDSSAKQEALPTLSMSQVQSIQLKEAGGKQIITIRLKQAAGGKDIQQKAAAYPGLLGYEESAALAKSIGKVFKLPGISVKDIAFTLKNGVITATITNSGSRLESASLSYQQALNMDLKFITFQIKGNIGCTIKASYTG